MRGTCEAVKETIQKDPALPKIGKEYLHRMRSGELTMGEFDKEIAYWMVNFLEDMRWRPAPSMPHEIVEYNEQIRRDPGFKMARAFWDQDHIRAYSATVQSIVSQNKGNWYWLLNIRKNIPSDDMSAQVKIRPIMRSYPRYVS